MNRSSISAEELFPCARWGSMDGGSLAVPRFRIFASPDGPAPPPPHAATDTIAAASRAVTPRRIYPFICIPFISDLSDAAQRAFPAYVMARHDLSVGDARSEEHTSELKSLMRISYAVFCLKKKTFNAINIKSTTNQIQR